MTFLDRTFQLHARGTTVQTEVLAGFTTFLTMAYIVLINPAILSTTGMPPAGVVAATCLAAGIDCLMMGLIANYPIALAPGMGLNAYFAFTVVQGMGVPWQTALGLVFIREDPEDVERVRGAADVDEDARFRHPYCSGPRARRQAGCERRRPLNRGRGVSSERTTNGVRATTQRRRGPPTRPEPPMPVSSWGR